jgi:hypothetical protein
MVKLPSDERVVVVALGISLEYYHYYDLDLHYSKQFEEFNCRQCYQQLNNNI